MEILVINDYSPDHLDRVMEAYKKYPQIRYLKNEKIWVWLRPATKVSVLPGASISLFSGCPVITEKQTS